MLIVSLLIGALIIAIIIGFVQVARDVNSIRIEKQQLNALIKDKKETQNKIQTSIDNLTAEKEKLLIEVDHLKTTIDEKYCERQKENEKLLEKQKIDIQNAVSKYADSIEQSYKEQEQKYDARISALKTEISQSEKALESVKSSLSAAAAANLRERELKEKMEFYSIKVPEKEQHDLNLLINLKEQFRNPVAISKLIWSEFFLKRTNDLCNRVLGTSTVCGIYKITNQLTQESYIGQSKNIADRFKQHIKCGLGIDASSNKLYNSMQKDGVWNFTFELLEKCSIDELNEKEKYWIQMYQSDKFGLNGTRGGS